MLNIATKPIDQAAVITPDTFTLTDAQRYGLLQVRGGEAARKLIAHMDEMGWPHPTGLDWQALREKGLISRRPSGYHDLLPKGLAAATEITREHCWNIGVHVMTKFPAGRLTPPRAICSCGQWSQTARSNSSADSVIGASFAAHVERMRDDPGGVKAKARVDAIYDRIGQKTSTNSSFPSRQDAPPRLPHLSAKAGAVVTPRATAPVRLER